MKILSPVIVLFCLACLAQADVITTTGGRIIQGTVVQSNAQSILILADYGTLSLPANVVQTVVPETDRRPKTLSTNTVTSPGRLPDWRIIISKLADKPWAENLRQIPATVITNGILKNVPYISFRCGIDYEVNIYGDLDNPAGIEVGMYRSLISKSYAKENAVSFVAAMLGQDADRKNAQSLNREKDVARAGGLTFDVTPATAEDSYGGWWVSVYDEKALDQARASDKELQAISVLNSSIIKNPTSASSGWSKDDLKYARPASASASPTTGIQPSTTAPLFSTDSGYSGVGPGHDHGSVYVHGYYRKNGTYVHSYTRRR